MRVALIHYWLVNQRGGEAVLLALCKLFPDAEIFTLFYDPEKANPIFRSHKVTASFLNPFRRYYRSLLPLMPMALESFDLRDFDLVISSESGPAKGVLVSAEARHICYVHTPMRYLWELYPDYLNRWTSSRIKRALMIPITNYLRLWDYASAARVDEFVANSENVKRRIHRCYRRDAEVIHPPVAVETFFWRPSEDYYLIVSELVPYKRLDLAVRAFSANGRKLKVVGMGPEYRELRRMAASNVEFCGHVPGPELRSLYAASRALVLPGEEDFGITPVESLASGKPVIAWERGGVLDTAAIAGESGAFLYPDATVESLQEGIERFEKEDAGIRPERLQAAMAYFSEAEFLRRFQRLLDQPGGPDSLPGISAGRDHRYRAQQDSQVEFQRQVPDQQNVEATALRISQRISAADLP
jgi:glycosyltransferase involved in cell wall biosynthesis